MYLTEVNLLYIFTTIHLEGIFNYSTVFTDHITNLHQKSHKWENGLKMQYRLKVEHCTERK